MSLNIAELNSSYTLRPIHYLGSKLRLLPNIAEVLNKYDPDMKPVCDLFAGSGVVSRYLSGQRKVVSVDIQEYSKILCEAMLLTSDVKIDPKRFVERCAEDTNTKKILDCFEDIIDFEKKALLTASLGDLGQLADLIDYGSILDYEHRKTIEANDDLKFVLTTTVKNIKENKYDFYPQAMVTRYYGGIYFSFQQAIEIDSLLESINQYTGHTRSILLAALLSTVSDIVNTVGKQFAQPLQVHKADGSIKTSISSKIIKDRTLSVYDCYMNWLSIYNDLEKTDFDHDFIKVDFLKNEEVLHNKEIGVFYADPPYTRYHYSRYYHVLETICLRDNPKISLTDRGDRTRLSRGKYRVDRYQSDFSINSKAESAFEFMFKKISEMETPLILSYSPFNPNQAVSPRLRTVNQLILLAQKYYRDVEIKDISCFNHSKLNSTENLLETSECSEVLICCKK